MDTLTLKTRSPKQTMALGRYLGEHLKGGEVFALEGPLGSGKTHLIKGVVEGLGALQADQVNSPTFVLVNEYSGRLDVYHIDAYRLDRPGDFDMLGFDDFLHPGSVVLIEWADRVRPALASIRPIEVKMAHAAGTHRAIAIRHAPDYLALAALLSREP